MLKKLKLKFVLVNMAIVLGMLLVIFFLVYSSTEQSLQGQADGMLDTLCHAAKSPGNPHAQQNVGLPYILMQIGNRGDVLASGLIRYDLTDESFLRELVDSVRRQGVSEGIIHEYNLRYKTEMTIGMQVVAFVDISSQLHALEDLIATSLWVGLASLVAFGFISVLLARWAVKPVDKAWKQQRQFISDASHELKTPLTVIMSNAELSASASDREEYNRYSGNILNASQKMRSLVEGMLELSRVDNGQVRKAFERLDMSKLVQDAVLPFEPVFFEKGLQLESQVQPGIFLTGNAQYLRQVVDILLDNAGKYADPGTVWLRFGSYGKNQCLLSVYNPSTPIPEEDAAHIFDRFYRADKARAGNGSFGLGLAIAKSAVEEHGGKIWLQTVPQGNMFCVLLPCEPV